MAWYDKWQRKRDEKFFDEMEKLMEESERKFNQALDEEMETLKKKRSSKITLIWIQSAIIESHNSSSFLMIFIYQISYLQRQQSTSSSIKMA